MCLIALRENKGGRGSNIPNKVIEHNRKANPDGFGIAWQKDGKLFTKRFGPSEVLQFEELLKTIDRDTTITYAAHWRWATHGPKCEEMSHPFVYTDKTVGDVAVFHNGVIQIKTGPDESDTYRYVKSVLANLESKWWRKAVYRFLVENTVSSSRLLVMTAKESVRLNSDMWELSNGIWYSTSPVPRWQTGYYSSGKGRGGGTDALKPYALPGSTFTAKTDNDDDDDGYEQWLRDNWDEDGVPNPLLPGETFSADKYESQSGWIDKTANHWVSPISEIAGDGDNGEQDIICDTCQTVGKVYFVDGKAWPDVPHQVFKSDKVITAVPIHE